MLAMEIGGGAEEKERGVSGSLGHPDRYPGAALVTGGARRIGRAIALDLARCGFAVAVHYHRSEARADELVRAIRSEGGRAVALAADLSRDEEARGLLGRAGRALGPVGLLVNNAAVFDYDDVASADRESWQAHMEPNLTAPLILTQAFAEALPADAGGLVVNMVDSRVLNPTPRHLSYTVSKAALWALTQSLARALAPRIRVNAIGPGPVLPPQGQSDQQFESRYRRLPLGRPATPEEIAAAIRFLLAAKSVTGQLLALDGGNHLADHRSQHPDLPPPLESVTGETAA